MQETQKNSGFIPQLGSSPGGGYNTPLQYSCLEISMDRGAWQATVQGVAESDLSKQLSTPYNLLQKYTFSLSIPLKVSYLVSFFCFKCLGAIPLKPSFLLLPPRPGCLLPTLAAQLPSGDFPVPSSSSLPHLMLHHPFPRSFSS